MGVGVAGLAALTGGEHPHPGRQFGRHVHHRLALAQESLGDVTADPGKSLDPRCGQTAANWSIASNPACATRLLLIDSSEQVDPYGLRAHLAEELLAVARQCNEMRVEGGSQLTDQ